MSEKLEDLIDRYFDIAYQQGKEGRDHDDIEGSAQAMLDAIRAAIAGLGRPAMSEAISRELLGKIVDEVFDGAIEDASVIEDIYAVIKRHEAPPPLPRKMLWQQDADNAEAGAKAVREILSPAPAELSVVAPIVRVKTMRLSDGRADHFVSIKVGDREVHPHVFREEFKAAYHVALYSWLLNGTAEPELMAFNEGEWPAQATELVGADPVQIDLLQEEVARLQDDLDEARQVLWPEWSTKILKVVRSYSGYDGYDDATEGVDLVAEVEEALSELHSEAEKLRKAAPAELSVGDGEASIIECLAAGEPFVFDPATNFLHADDGTVEGGIRYLPADLSVQIKPLEWNPYRAETPFGWYDINDQSDVPESELKGRPPFLLCGSRMAYSRHGTLDAARSAAQADYETRIRAALSASEVEG